MEWLMGCVAEEGVKMDGGSALGVEERTGMVGTSASSRRGSQIHASRVTESQLKPEMQSSGTLC